MIRGCGLAQAQQDLCNKGLCDQALCD